MKEPRDIAAVRLENMVPKGGFAQILSWKRDDMIVWGQE